MPTKVKMQLFVMMAALLHIGLCDHIAVRRPYLNPAGVTYVNAFHTEEAAYASATQLHAVAAHIQYAAPAIPAKIETHHVGYATAQVPAVATLVPFMKHVPTVSQVPVTRIKTQPALLQKQIDIAKPALTTRKVEVRRPVIQKQFYDIEERVIRPAGSAVVELDEPISKIEKGSTVIQPLAQNVPLAYPQAHGIYAHAGAIADAPVAPVAIPVIAHAPVHVTVAPVISHASAIQTTSSPLLLSSSSFPIPNTSGSNNSGDESIVVENPDFRNAIDQVHIVKFQTSEPRIIAKSNGTPMDAPITRFVAHDPSPTVIPSQKISVEDNKINQNRLIELLTARGDIIELGFGREGAAGKPIGNIGSVRAPILSATPTPKYAETANERVFTHRIVVNRPIETLQEYDIVESATKLEKVSVQQPTLIKTARTDHLQVHGSIGKTLVLGAQKSSEP